MVVSPGRAQRNSYYRKSIGGTRCNGSRARILKLGSRAIRIFYARARVENTRETILKLGGATAHSQLLGLSCNDGGDAIILIIGVGTKGVL